MKKPVVLVVVVLLVGGLGAAAWLLFRGGTEPAARGGAGSQSAAGPDASGPGLSARPVGSTAAGAARAGAAAAAEPRKLPPPPANGESTVVGRVVDAASKAGIAKAAVVLRAAHGEFGVTAESGPDGAFVLERVPGVIGARVFVNAAGFGPRVLRDVHVPPHDRLDLGSIEVDRGTAIRGRVVAALGAPIEGALVDLLEARAQESEFSEDLVQIFRELRADDESLDEVATAADGTFTFLSAAPGTYMLAARKPGWQLRFSSVLTLAAGAASPHVDIKLGEAKPFRGIVKDQGGNPVAGASVAALEIVMEDMNFLPKSQKTTTGADGRFSYSTLGGGMIAVVVEAAGYSGGATQSNLKADGKEVEFVLKKATRVEGRVFDRTTNTGLAGAVVVAFRLDSEIALEETRSGPDGAYVIEHGPSGDKVSVYAKLPGYTMASSLDPVSEEDDSHGDPLSRMMSAHEFAAGSTVHQDIALVGGGTIAGKVIDEATGNGIAGAEITAKASSGLGFFGLSDPVKTTSGADGAFTLPMIGAGKVGLAAHAPGYLPAKDAVPPPEETPDAGQRMVDYAAIMEGRQDVVEVAPGRPVTGQVIRLRRGAEVEVLVTNPEGAGMAGATVSWAAANDDFGSMLGGSRRKQTAVCDAAGKVRLKGLPPRKGIVLAARHPDFPAGGSTTIDTMPPPERPVTIALRPAASLSGVLLDADGKPAAERALAFHPDDGAVGRAFGDWTWTGKTVVTDSAGKFLIEHLPPGPGKITLELRPEGDESGEQTVLTQSNQCLDPAQAAVTLVAGKREQVTLQLLRTLEISGTVSDADGRPLAEVMLMAARVSAKEDVEYLYAQSAADGTYSLNGLPPGEYRVRADPFATTPESRPEGLTRTVRAGSMRVDFHFAK